MTGHQLGRIARFYSIACFVMALSGAIAWIGFALIYLRFRQGHWSQWFSSPEVYRNYLMSFRAALGGVIPGLIVLFGMSGWHWILCSRALHACHTPPNIKGCIAAERSGASNYTLG